MKELMCKAINKFYIMYPNTILTKIFVAETTTNSGVITYALFGIEYQHSDNTYVDEIIYIGVGR